MNIRPCGSKYVTGNMEKQTPSMLFRDFMLWWIAVYANIKLQLVPLIL